MPSYLDAYKELQGLWFWNQKPYSKTQAWIDMIILAEPTGKITLSERSLAMRWEWSRSAVTRFLEELKNVFLEPSPEPKSNHLPNQLTILNYSKYTESRTIKRTKIEPSPKPSKLLKDMDLKAKAQEVLDYLNEKMGTRYRDVSIIMARLRQKKTVSECKEIVDNKMQDPYFIENPRLMNPVTLFRPKHWDAYLNYKPTGKKMSGVTQQNVSFLDKWRPIER